MSNFWGALHIIYALGIIGFACTVILDAIVAIKNQSPCGNYYGNHTIGVFCESVAVFIFAKYNCPCLERLNLIIEKIAKFSFGAYLVHPWVRDLFIEIGFSTKAFNSFIAVPAQAMAVFIVSMAISAIINNIPIIKKYIV